MFMRLTVHLRRKEHLAQGDASVTLTREFLMPDDMVGELQASDNAHKVADEAIDALYAAEKEQKERRG